MANLIILTIHQIMVEKEKVQLHLKDREETRKKEI